jgi:hypothetical protein
MPNVLVETRGGWLGAKRTALLDAIRHLLAACPIASLGPTSVLEPP